MDTLLNKAELSSRKTHDNIDMLARNRLANVSFFVCSVGELIVLGILAGILQAIVIPGDTDSNTRALSVVCAYSAGVWSESSPFQRTRSLSFDAELILQSFVLYRGSCGSSTDQEISYRLELLT